MHLAMSRGEDPDETAPISRAGDDGKTQPLLSSTQVRTPYGTIEVCIYFTSHVERRNVPC